MGFERSPKRIDEKIARATPYGNRKTMKAMVLKTTLAAAFTTSGVRGIAIFWEISKDLLTIKMEVEEVRLCVTS